MAAGRGIEVIPVATKVDKLRRSERAVALARFAQIPGAPIFPSATSNEGIEELRRRILGIGRASTIKNAELP
jgi:50S ribosomal subunit-associated GTPase HflX